MLAACGSDSARAPGTRQDAGAFQPRSVLQIDPPGLDFGQQIVQTSATELILIRNTGDEVVVIEDIVPQGPLDEAFTFSFNRNSVPPNGVIQLEVTYYPTVAEPHSSKLLVSVDDARIPTQIILLQGAAVDAEFSAAPGDLGFGSVAVNSQELRRVTVTNSGELDLDVELLEGQNVRLCDSSRNDPSVFCLGHPTHDLSTNGRFPLAAGTSTDLEVEFHPVIPGTRERGNFTLRGCHHALCEVEIVLSGLGT